MHIHSVQEGNIERQIDRLLNAPKKAEPARPYEDPVREFARASQVRGMVAGWRTYPLEERKRLVKNAFGYIPRQLGDPREGRKAETEEEFQSRQLERWRGLCVIIQEESRMAPGNRSPEVAIAALKQLFPDHDWKTKPMAAPPPEK